MTPTGKNGGEQTRLGIKPNECRNVKLWIKPNEFRNGIRINYRNYYHSNIGKNSCNAMSAINILNRIIIMKPHNYEIGTQRHIHKDSSLEIKERE